VVDIIADQRLDVAVEDDAHKLAAGVDHRAPRVAADDVASRDEVERCFGIDFRPMTTPALRERPGSLVAVVFGMLKGTPHRGPGGDRFAVLFVAFDSAE